MRTRNINHLSLGPQVIPRSNGTSTEITPTPSPENSRPGTPLPGHLLSAKLTAGKGGISRRAKRAANSATASSGDEESRRKSKPIKTKSKTLRKWDADGNADEYDGKTLDYSTTSHNNDSAIIDESKSKMAGMESIDAESFGTRTRKGQFVLKDLDNEVHSILGASEKKSQPSLQSAGVVNSSISAISGLFRNVIGGKVLTKSDLEKPMKGMEEHLLKKNVAREAAVRLCEGVEGELIGVKTGSFESKSMWLEFSTISNKHCPRR